MYTRAAVAGHLGHTQAGQRRGLVAGGGRGEEGPQQWPRTGTQALASWTAHNRKGNHGMTGCVAHLVVADVAEDVVQRAAGGAAGVADGLRRLEAAGEHSSTATGGQGSREMKEWRVAPPWPQYSNWGHRRARADTAGWQ